MCKVVGDCFSEIGKEWKVEYIMELISFLEADERTWIAYFGAFAAQIELMIDKSTRGFLFLVFPRVDVHAGSSVFLDGGGVKPWRNCAFPACSLEAVHVKLVALELLDISIAFFFRLYMLFCQSLLHHLLYPSILYSLSSSHQIDLDNVAIRLLRLEETNCRVFLLTLSL